MKSLYEILRSAKLGAGAAPDFHTALMAQKMPFAKGSGAEHEYTGAVPVTFTANGQPLLDYLISGNTVQSGTPNPDNPIMPEGTGDLETSGTKVGQYKIPISSAGQTTPVYLGEVETTRKIKKLVLTGEENIRTGTGFVYVTAANIASYSTSARCICTHYPQEGTEYCINTTNQIRFYVNSDVDTFKSYLAAQYAAGSPVTVWYVLVNEETAVVNEPLMKIGDYADTVSKAQAGVEIPTARGTNTLDVLTDVKPSEVYIKYKG